MTKNVTLLGANYPDVPSIILPQTGGGNAEFFADRAGWMGANSELIKTLDLYSFKLSETIFPSWTPTTSATAIMSRITSYDTFVADMANYEYIVQWECFVENVYNEGYVVTGGHQLKSCCYQTNYIVKRPSSVANIEAENNNGNATFTVTKSLWDYLRLSDSSHLMLYDNSYGFYFGSALVTFSNSTTNTPTVYIGTPTLNARVHNSYMSDTAFNNLDQDKTVIKMQGSLYRISKGSGITANQIYLVDKLFNNGIR